VRGALLAVAALALIAPSAAQAARYAVGVAPGTSLAALAEEINADPASQVTSGDVKLRALFVDGASAQELGSFPGVSYVERLDTPKAMRRLAFVPNDPLYNRQWYLDQIQAFDAWPDLPSLDGPTVAVLDSGIDGSHPEFKGRIAGARSFIGGSPYEDRRGHGTFVAGEIAAATGNAVGIAGIAFSAQLLIAKIARPDGSIPLEAEARAIRWAADRGAKVISMSLAGVRDPFKVQQDTYSPLEASAVSYARKRGALVVAAVGNSDQAPHSPWNFAGYPAALPHVLGVSAISRDGSVPEFSNRDMIYNDLTAPGDDIYSTLPRSLQGMKANCANVGYSDCGPSEFRHAAGTSFAAPLVAGAAALLFAEKPGLTPDQAENVLERSAQDVTPATGCHACAGGRDRYTGWGRLSVSTAVGRVLAGAIPRPDHYEANDNAGSAAWPLKWRRGTLTASLDFWDDQSDVYRIKLRRGQRFRASLKGPARTDVALLLWKPGTRTVLGPVGRARKLAARASSPGSRQRISAYRVRKTGQYFLEVRITAPGSGPYALSISKTTASKKPL
jgi:subtilisin family serine protease